MLSIALVCRLHPTRAKPRRASVEYRRRRILMSKVSPKYGFAARSTVANRWDEKTGLRTGCGVRSQVIDVLEAQIKRRPAMKKVSTVAVKPSKKISQQKLIVAIAIWKRPEATVSSVISTLVAGP